VIQRDLDGYTDLHSHLVPGVDDGSRTLEEGRTGLIKLLRSGVRRVVTTPHFDASLTRELALMEERLAEIDRGWESLKAMSSSEFPDLELRRGQEVMLDIPDPDLSDPRLFLAETPYVLVEWPGLRVPPSTVPVLARFREAGIKPIIAHPERYRGLDKDMYLPGEWKAEGALLQVNYGSLLGRYGDLPRKRALTLLARGWADLLASDFHGRAHLSPNLLEAKAVLFEAGGGAQFGLLAGMNPTRILRGEDPVRVPPLPIRPGVLQRLRGVFQPRDRR
jgi:protein-tyrosine phosphatase